MNGWNDSLTNSLQRIIGLCTSYKIMHMKSTVFYRRRSEYANNIGLFGAGLAAVLRGSQEYSDFSFLPVWLPEIGGLIAGTALLVIRMGKYEERVHTHKTTAAELASLIENIRRQLALSYHDRMNGQSYHEWVCKSYDSIIGTSLPVPPSIEHSFTKLAKIRKLVIPDELLLNSDINPDAHIELASMELFSADEPTPKVNPRDVQTVDADIESQSDTKDDESESSSASHSSQLGGWGKIIKALGKYDDTTMRHEIQQFERICRPDIPKFDRAITK
jgi:hypothetical protein